MIYTKEGRALKRALKEHPEEFLVSIYKLTHEPTGQTYWIGNGPCHFDGFGNTPKCLGLIERHIIYAVLQIACGPEMCKSLDLRRSLVISLVELGLDPVKSWPT